MKRFLGDQPGASFVITALAFPVIIGFAGLGLSDLETVVRDVAADNGFVYGSHGAAIVKSPPDVGGLSTFGGHCVVGLDETADRTVEFTGTADVTSACGIASNSNSDEAIYVGGNATLIAEPPQAEATPGRAAMPRSHNTRRPSRCQSALRGAVSELQADPVCAGISSSPTSTATANIIRSSATQVSFQTIGKVFLADILTCYPCSRSGPPRAPPSPKGEGTVTCAGRI